MALNWRGAWNVESTYQVQDVVFYLTASYVALAINTDQAPVGDNIGTIWGTFAVGLTGAQGAQGTQGTIGATGATGAQGVAGNTGAAGQGFAWRNAYSNVVTYNTYDCVSYIDGNSYICIANGTLNVTPGVNAHWNILAQGVSSSLFIPSIIYSAAGTPLPAAASGLKGARAVVSDATSPTYMGTYTSGGAITCEVICSYNGSTYTWLTK